VRVLFDRAAIAWNLRKIARSRPHTTGCEPPLNVPSRNLACCILETSKIPNERSNGGEPPPGTHARSQKLFFLQGVDVSMVRQEIAILRDLELVASELEFENGSLGTSQVRPRAAVPPPPAREQF
jgi:hypothetical protein